MQFMQLSMKLSMNCMQFMARRAVGTYKSLKLVIKVLVETKD